jgi:DNA polymerase-3 subunit delta'
MPTVPSNWCTGTFFKSSVSKLEHERVSFTSGAKMRIQSFVGNHRIVERLRTKLREGRFPHGLIFSGPEGVGKHTFAVMMAKALNCLNAPPDDFCNDCASCRKIESATHPDVLKVTVEEEATQIKIAQIRRVLEVLGFQPLEGRNKVFIVDPAERLNPEAANALLKALEEPPQNSFFVLVTVNVHELLLTVRSRCQVYNFAPLSGEELRSQGVSDELIARWSQGSIGRARTLEVTQLKSDREFVLDFLETAVTASETQFQELLRASADLGRGKQEFEERMGILAVLISDLLYTKEGIPEKIINIDIGARLGKLSASVPVERLLRMAEFLGFIESSLKNHINKQMLTDELAMIANEPASHVAP